MDVGKAQEVFHRKGHSAARIDEHRRRASQVSPEEPPPELDPVSGWDQVGGMSLTDGELIKQDREEHSSSKITGILVHHRGK